MKRGILMACLMLALIATVVIIAVRWPVVRVPPEPVPRPVGQLPAAKTSVVVVVPPTGATAAVPPALPVYVPPAVSTPGLAKVVDRRLPFEERVHGLVAGELTEVTDAQDLATVTRLLGDPTEDDTVRHEIANLLLRSGYAALEASLLKVLENPAEQERFRSLAVQHLGTLLLDAKFPCDRPALAGRLRALLTDRHLKVRREALLVFSRYNDAAVLNQVREMLADPAPDADALRDLAIRCAAEKNMQDCMPAIRPQARSTNEIVRIAAMTALSQWGDEESRPAFTAAASSPRVRLQRAGKAALDRLNVLAGKNGG